VTQLLPSGAEEVDRTMAAGSPAELERALVTTPAAELLAHPAVAPEAVGDPRAAYDLAKRANVLRVQAAVAAWDSAGRGSTRSVPASSPPDGRDEVAV
jgi:hypothetical protein